MAVSWGQLMCLHGQLNQAIFRAGLVPIHKHGRGTDLLTDSVTIGGDIPSFSLLIVSLFQIDLSLIKKSANTANNKLVTR